MHLCKCELNYLDVSVRCTWRYCHDAVHECDNTMPASDVGAVQVNVLRRKLRQSPIRPNFSDPSSNLDVMLWNVGSSF